MKASVKLRVSEILALFAVTVLLLAIAWTVFPS